MNVPHKIVENAEKNGIHPLVPAAADNAISHDIQNLVSLEQTDVVTRSATMHEFTGILTQ
jgi:hypothetical protein